MSSALTVLLSLLGSSVIASVVSGVLTRKRDVDNRLWNARVSAYSRLLGKLLAWSVSASPSLADIKSGRILPTDFNQVRAEYSEALILASGDLRKKLDDFASYPSQMDHALDDVNAWHSSHGDAQSVDLDSVPEVKRFLELRQHVRVLREGIVTSMRHELGIGLEDA